MGLRTEQRQQWRVLGCCYCLVDGVSRLAKRRHQIAVIVVSFVDILIRGGDCVDMGQSVQVVVERGGRLGG
jgi:hypothetical protein